jgi:hypothetical protein
MKREIKRPVRRGDGKAKRSHVHGWPVSTLNSACIGEQQGQGSSDQAGWLFFFFLFFAFLCRPGTSEPEQNQVTGCLLQLVHGEAVGENLQVKLNLKLLPCPTCPVLSF